MLWFHPDEAQKMLQENYNLNTSNVMVSRSYAAITIHIGIHLNTSNVMVSLSTFQF